MYDKLIKNHFARTSVFLALILLLGCTSPSVESQVEGKWMMTKVLQHDNDVTAEHNPAGDRWIEFMRDKTFKSGGSPYGENTGTWYLKNDGNVLYLASSVENDDSEWNLTIGVDEMQWTGIGDPGKEAFTLIHTRRD